MKSKKNLVLVGMMGSGKSTIGQLLARSLNYPFYDIDKIIEEKLNMKINEIFEKKGENFFRKLEEKISVKYLDLENIVIALGGGGFLNNTIRRKTSSKSRTFWLNLNISTLLKRIKKNKKRPIANVLNDKELKNLIIQRSFFYSSADFKINCEKKTKKQILKEINNLYEIN